MLKEIWLQISQLKTPERRLLIGGLFCAVIVLWLSFRKSNTEQVIELKMQVKILNTKMERLIDLADKKLNDKQDQLDACRSEGLIAAQKKKRNA